MKNSVQKMIVAMSIAATLAVPLVGMASSPERHTAYRYVWGCIAVTEWSGVYHYTRVWIEPVGTDSGRKYGTSLTRATAYGDAIFNNAHSRYGR